MILSKVTLNQLLITNNTKQNIQSLLSDSQTLLEFTLLIQLVHLRLLLQINECFQYHFRNLVLDVHEQLVAFLVRGDVALDLEILKICIRVGIVIRFRKITRPLDGCACRPRSIYTSIPHSTIHCLCVY